MAEGKKSFVLYSDLIHTVGKLPNDKAGELFKIILDYVNDKNPAVDDLLMSISFEPIKQQLKRDLVKYQSLCDKNALNGSKGGRPKTNPNEPKKPTGLFGNPSEPKKADNDSDNDNDNDSDSAKEELILYPSFNDFWNLYDKKSGNRKACEVKWNKIKQNVKENIMHHVKDYVVSTPDVKFRKNPETYLNQEHWTNEILTADIFSNSNKFDHDRFSQLTTAIREQYPNM